MLGEGTPFAPHLRKTPPYAGSLPLDDPRLSPIHADLSELPPMLIQTGGYDLLLTENEQLAEKAKADGTSVTFTVYPEMPHVFPLVLPELAESIAACEEVRDFAIDICRHKQRERGLFLPRSIHVLFFVARFYRIILRMPT